MQQHTVCEEGKSAVQDGEVLRVLAQDKPRDRPRHAVAR